MAEEGDRVLYARRRAPATGAPLVPHARRRGAFLGEMDLSYSSSSKRHKGAVPAKVIDKVLGALRALGKPSPAEEVVEYIAEEYKYDNANVVLRMLRNDDKVQKVAGALFWIQGEAYVEAAPPEVPTAAPGPGDALALPPAAAAIEPAADAARVVVAVEGAVVVEAEVQAPKALAALRAVVDPLLGRDVVSSGMATLRRVGAVTHLELDVGTPAHPAQRKIAEDCAAALTHVAGIKELEITLRASGCGARVSSKHAGLLNVRSAIAVSSCKGGVGKSTVALNLAAALAAMGARVGLLDADVHGPSVPSLLGLRHGAFMTASPASPELMLPVDRGGLRYASIGFVGNKADAKADADTVLGAASGAMRGVLASRVAEQLATKTDWGELDYLVVDLPPGVGDIHLTLCQALHMDATVLVTTPSDLAKADVGRGAALFRDVGLPCVAVVQNMAYFTCGKCDEKHFIFGKGHVPQLAMELGLRDDCTFDVPISPAISAANESGSGDALFRPDAAPSAEAAAFTDLAELLVGHIYIRQRSLRGAKQTQLAWDEKRDTLVLRSFDEEGAASVDIDAWQLRDTHSKRQNARRPADRAPPVKLIAKRITPVGRTAVAIDWSDGVSNDVYTIESLASMPPRTVTTKHEAPRKSD
ncbi:P-loop containing nucleoside triphosphate hydrolase protein [Pelagophyceae sp. CCMP2097]|nr:P-loop containing nucleoside triphosphate hydrolase protein [Pelagophyceae sp. CCMP2097]